MLKAKHEILKTIAGVGNVVAFELLILLLELGKLTRRQIASLAGLLLRKLMIVVNIKDIEE